MIVDGDSLNYNQIQELQPTPQVTVHVLLCCEAYQVGYDILWQQQKLLLQMEK